MKEKEGTERRRKRERGTEGQRSQEGKEGGNEREGGGRGRITETARHINEWAQKKVYRLCTSRTSRGGFTETQTNTKTNKSSDRERREN